MEGNYWLKCCENGGDAEWASVFPRRDGVMMCHVESIGTYGLNAVHENMTDVKWASAMIIIPANVEVKRGAQMPETN